MTNSLLELFEKTAKDYSDFEALVYDEIRLTWSQLYEQVINLANGLAYKNIHTNDEVILWLNSSPCFIVSYFALLSRGAIVTPLNPSMMSGDYALLDLHPKAIITSESLLESCLAAIDSEPPTLFICPNESDLKDWALLQQEQHESDKIDSNNPAIQMFSSGSTGIPKKLYRTHCQCLAEIKQTRNTMQITHKDIIFCALPLHHSHGMGNALWASVGSGAKLVLLKKPEPLPLQAHRILSIIKTEKVTIFPGVPFLFSSLTRASRDENLSSVRLCFSAGAPLPIEVYQNFLDLFRFPIRQLYGCTEAGALTINLDSITETNFLSVGKPMKGIQLEIVDEFGALCAPGNVGEIRFKCNNLTDGYIDTTEVNKKHFHNGWFSSGDMGTITNDGDLKIIGRKAFMIDIAGNKVYANEIEAILETHPSIQEAAVKGIKHETIGEVIEAYLVTTNQINKDNIFTYCREKLPSYKQPKKLNFVTELPRTSLGKLQRNLLN